MSRFLIRWATQLWLPAATLLVLPSCTKNKEAPQQDANGWHQRAEKAAGGGGVVVIGQEAARAAEAEKRWRQRVGPLESPLPNCANSSWNKGLGLIDPEPDDLDATFRKVVREYVAADSRRREAVRDSIDNPSSYDLLDFAGRASVFAMRENKVDAARDGLSAVAMITQERIDFRDILMHLSLLYHAATRVGANADKLFREIALLAEPKTGKLIVGFANLPPPSRELRASSAFDEIQTEKGLGFIGRGFKKYNPTIDFKPLAVEVARLIAADKYRPGPVQVANDLPAVWLGRGKQPELEAVLARVRGGAMVVGTPRPAEDIRNISQQISIFVVETSQDSDARKLLELSRSKGTLGHTHSLLGVAKGPLFALVVGGSVVQGVEGTETTETLARFEGGLAAILARYAAKVR